MYKRFLILIGGTLAACLAVAALFWFGSSAQAAHLAQASAPGLVTYQGLLADDAGDPVANDNYDLKFELCTAPGCGSVLWTETHASHPVQDGYFTVVLGGQTALDATHFDGTERWLRVSAKGPADADYSLFAPQRITAVPYALQAQKAQDADTLDGIDSSGFVTGAHDHWGGSWSGNGAGLTLSGTYALDIIFDVSNSDLWSGSGTSAIRGQTGAGSGYPPQDRVGVWGDIDEGYGVYGASKNIYGVYGVGGQAGLYGISEGGYGVSAWSGGDASVAAVYANGGYSAAGVNASSTSGDGVYGTSSSGYGGRFVSFDGHALVADGDTLNYGLNPRQIATLRWYEAVSITQPLATPVGDSPRGVAFDGDHIWVTNANDSTVTKIRASDGLTLGAYSVGGFYGPEGIAFDGLYLWIGCWNDKVVQMRASDGSVVNTLDLPSGSQPIAVAFDGTYVWAARRGDDRVTRMLAYNPTVSDTYSVGGEPSGIAFDGVAIWTSNYVDGTVSRLAASNPTISHTFSVGTGPNGVVFDGANVWIANSIAGTVSCLRASDGTTLHTISVGNTPTGVAFDGGYIWVTNSDAARVTKIRADGQIVNAYPTGASPYNVAFDGSHVWVVNRNSNTVSKH